MKVSHLKNTLAIAGTHLVLLGLWLAVAPYTGASPLLTAAFLGPSTLLMFWLAHRKLHDNTVTAVSSEQNPVLDAISSSAEAIIILDASGAIREVNAAFADMAAVAPERLVGTRFQLYRSESHSNNHFQLIQASLAKEHHWQGEMWWRHNQSRSFPALIKINAVMSDQGKPSHYLCSFIDLSEQKNAELEIYKLAYFDQLTGLANSRLLADHVNHAVAASERTRDFSALLMIDIDRFKSLNDTMGHVAGDAVLVEIADRLKNLVRKSDTVARYGGDEFVILLESLDSDIVGSHSKARVVAEKILTDISQTLATAVNNQHFLTASIGITLFNDSAIGFDGLLQQLELALYEAKSRGKNQICFYDKKIQQEVTRRVNIEHALKNALDNRAFELHFQPQVTSNHHIFGAEALLRWHPPGNGMPDSPAEFIPIAEESGLIVPIGTWVLETACAQLRQWQDNPALPAIHLSINISPVQFRDDGFVATVHRILAATGVDPAFITFEITESVLMDNNDAAAHKMAHLREAGISFSIDDFGTGYCSLAYLKNLPISEIKIDRSFVQGVLHDNSDAEIVRTIISMGQALKFRTVAEGVETVEQELFLMENGCRIYQGFLFSKPLPAQTFTTFLVATAKHSLHRSRNSPPFSV